MWSYKYQYFFLFIANLMTLCLASYSQDPNFSFSGNIVLKGAYAVNIVEKRIEKRDLYICQGLFVEEGVGKKCAEKIIDVSGKWLIPALVDVHVHARGQLGGHNEWINYTPREVAKIFARSGVLYIIDAMQDEEIIFPARDSQRSNSHIYEAKLYCAGGAFTPTSGHGFEYLTDGVKKTALRVVDTPKQALQEMNGIALKRPDFVKIMYDHRGEDVWGRTISIKDGEFGVLGRAMSKEVMTTLISRGLALNLKPYVHIGVWQDAQEAIQAGALIINHLGEGPIPEKLLELISKIKPFWIPTLAAQHDLLYISKNPNILQDSLLNKVASKKIIYSYLTIGDTSEDHNDELFFIKRHQKKHGKWDQYNLQQLLKAGAILLVGSDVPEIGTFIGWSTHREMALLVSLGLTPWEALAGATINAGKLLGVDIGLSVGAEANVIVLNESPIDNIWNTTKISKVVHRGVVIHSY